MQSRLKDSLILVSAAILLTIAVWLPHFLSLHNLLSLDFSAGFNTIYKNFDGLEYIVIAKSWYNPSIISQFPLNLSSQYYAAHFPGFSIAIALFAPLLGYLKAMLFVSLLATIAASLVFYILLRDFQLSNHPLVLSLLFLVLPARWVIVHSVGSAEPLFIFFTLACVYGLLQYEKTQRYLWIFVSAITGLGAQITRPPGALLFLAIVLYIHWKLFRQIRTQGFSKTFVEHLKYAPFIVMPIGLLAIFYWYSIPYHDFFAYFHSGDNIHLMFPPFQVFNKHQFWVGEIWLEDIVYIFLLGFSAAITLWKQKRILLSLFVWVYLLATTLVAHRDISRYSLPIFPFVLIAFEKFLTSREFRWVMLIASLGIYLYAQNFIIENVAPVANLAIFN